ncbi:MAG: efflux RND transporter permease subunit, partial [Planctomycetes bacterium]|nr:efflux RND transporter permease subunit [Planctomycetota bacterium]
MSIPELFIRRPVTTTLLMMGILLFGIVAYRLLPVSELPNVDFPTLQVSAALPGASPETMASSVATPLERQFTTIEGLQSMTSSSTLGNTQITLQFALSRNLDGAALDVMSAINQAQRLLPPQMPSPPFFRKVNPADQPVIYISLRSETLPLYTVDEYAETYMAQRISTVSGVAQVQVFGSQKYAVRIQVNPNVLTSLGIGIDQVQQAITTANVNIPTGTLQGLYQAFTVQATGQLTRADAYRPLLVTYRNGAPVYLRQLARVIDSVENDKVASWQGDTRAIVLAIQRQPGTNTVQVVDGVKALLPGFRAQIPMSIDMTILYDRSESIRASVRDLEITLLISVILVILVIFFFLRNVSATIIPSLALPLSIIGTFSAMYLLSYSLDNLSLMALTLSVGFVVDDAIVMLENIVRHVEMGKPRLQAALDGSREIGFTILSMTLSLAAVFIPLLFMGGILGRLLHEFAVTITVAILVSGFVSLSLSPMLSSRFLRPPRTGRRNRLYALSERFFEGLFRGYKASLGWVLRHGRLMILLSIVLVVATGYLFVIIPKDFIPSQDTGQIFGFTQGAQDISFESMVRHQMAINQVIAQDPAVEAFMSTVGSFGLGGINTGLVFLHLKPTTQRPPVDQVIQRLYPKLAQIPGINVFLQNPPTIRVGGRLTQNLYQYTLEGPDTAELYQWGPQVEAALRSLPDLQGVTSDLQLNSLLLVVDIDRDQATALGVTADQIENALYSAYGSRQVSTIYTPNNEYQVILEVEPQYQNQPADLSTLYITSQTPTTAVGGQTTTSSALSPPSSGSLVPLSAVAKQTRTVGPLSVNHTGQLPSVTISFNLRPGVALSQGIAEIGRAVSQLRMPTSLATGFSGQAQAFQTSLSGMWLLLLMAIVVIYIVLGVLYESFIHPLTILSGLPSAGVGALLTLLIFHEVLSIYSFVGIIMLIGIVKKNAIMMIDFALAAERGEGKKPADAIFEGSLLRFRPIMMTTMAALMGTLPIALGIGAGAEARRPLGLAVVGGLFFSQFVTLYITPVIYIYLDR